MRDNLYIKMYEQWLKRNYGEDIANAPVNSMTPYYGELPDGKIEHVFVVKAEEWLYKPLKGKTIEDTAPMAAKAYTEGENLIWGFNIEPDINLECVIPKNKIKKFLSVLKEQEKLTVVILNHITLNVVWLTNNYPFDKVKDKFNPFFEYYGVK